MQAIYDNGIREVLRDIPIENVGGHLVRMLELGAKEVSVRPEPCDGFGPETINHPQRKRRKGVMVGGRAK